jgi:hypothetical protein
MFGNFIVVFVAFSSMGFFDRVKHVDKETYRGHKNSYRNNQEDATV